MKYLVIIVIIIAAVGGGGALLYREKAAADTPPSRQTAKVERGDIKVSITATGAVASNKDVDIKCKASGEVMELPYDISNDVKPGAMLMRVDTTDEDRAVDQAQAVLQSDAARVTEAQLSWEEAKLNLVTMRQRAEASLASAQAKANDADSKSKRTAELFDQKLSSKEELETAQTTAALAHADVQTAQAALAELEQQKIAVDLKQHDIDLAEAQQRQDKIKSDIAEQSKKYCQVFAPPMEGNPTGHWTVSALTVQIGTLVQSGTSSVSGGTAVMTLSDLSHIYVLATVDESDIGHVAVGQEARITADSYRGVQFKGRVDRIATKGVNTSNVVTFEVKVEVTSRNRLLLKPMMTANVEIVSAEKKDAVLVPMQAISRKHAETVSDDDAPAAPPSGGAILASADTAPSTQKAALKVRPVVYPGTAQVVTAAGTTEPRDVRVGINDGLDYEVISGLEPGDTVVLNKAGADSKFSGRGRRGG